MYIISFDIGIKNMAYCIGNFINNEFKINKLEKIDLNCKNNNIQMIIDSTIEFLDYISSDFLKDEKIIILIECQMTSKMKIIQTVINTYYKLINKYENVEIETIYLSPKHKLNLIKNYITQIPDSIINNKIVNDKYKQNKLDSIIFSKWILENIYKNDDILEYFNSLKKKDDISDALLMVIYYYESKVILKID